jgi:hypothetical protein
LSFLTNVFLVGEQNNPSEKSWLTKQADSGELQVYFRDGTAMFSIELLDSRITFTRHGEKPSLPYMLQESILIHGVLDEIQNAATVEDIEVEKRLLQVDNTAIDGARKTLPARKAE